jgi:hypothetical protein
MLQSSSKSCRPYSNADKTSKEPCYTQQTKPYAIRNSLTVAQQPIALQLLAYDMTQQQNQAFFLPDDKATIELNSQIQAYQSRNSPELWIEKIEAFNDISLKIPSMHVEDL